MKPLMIYEYTGQGFDGGTDATDHLVFWFASPSEESADALAKRLNLNKGDTVGPVGTSAGHHTLAAVDAVIP